MLYPAIVGRVLSRVVKPTFIVVGVGLSDMYNYTIRSKDALAFGEVDWLDVVDVRLVGNEFDKSPVKRIFKSEMEFRLSNKGSYDFVNCKLDTRGKTARFRFTSDIPTSVSVFGLGGRDICGARGVDVHVISSFAIKVTDFDCELYGFDVRSIGKKETMLSVFTYKEGLKFIPESDFISMANSKLVNPLNVQLSDGKVIGKGFDLPLYSTKAQ